MSRVAIYIRKSRGEIEHLEKHREQLIELADRNNWRYNIYQEIGTSDSIIKRKEFSRLLDKIENDCYSKILVVALDRLSWNEQDQADIFQILKEHDVLQKDKLSEDIKVLEIQLANLNNINKKQSVINAKEALDILYNYSDESKANKILKTVIKQITWTRKENDINIDIEFL